MKQMPRILTLLVAALSISATAFAAPETLNIDAGHSNVGFNVRHFFAKTPGRFTDYSGTVQFDPKNLSASSVNVTIQAASINTAHEKRDGHLKGGDFFEVEKHPTLTFKSTKVYADGGKTAVVQGEKFKIDGELTIKGTTKPVTLDATFLGSGSIAIGGNSMGTVAGFEAVTKINRKDYNIVWNRALDQGGTMLGDDIEITLAVEAKTPQAPRPAAPAAAPAAPATDKK